MSDHQEQQPTPEPAPAPKYRRFRRDDIIKDLIENGYDEDLAPKAVDCFLNLLRSNPAVMGKLGQSKDDKQFGSYCFFQGFIAGCAGSAHWN